MRITYLLILFLFPCIGNTQNGFIQSYDFEEGGLGFTNMLLTEDTLVIFGSAKHPELQQWGIYFAKLDTTGNVLDHRVHYDSVGHSFIFEQGYGMIKTLDNGYAITGQMFGREAAVLIRLDKNGNVIYIREYPDETVLNIRHWNLIETSNGFLTTGVKQQTSDGLWDAFIMGTDTHGNKLWETSYGSNGVWDRLQGIQKITENEFLITGYTYISSLEVSDFADLWAIPKAVKIDTLGQIISEWAGEIDYAGGSGGAFSHLFRTLDGNWVNEGAVSTVIDENTMVFQGEIVKRDTNFNVIWNTSFGQPSSNQNNFIDLAASPDGGWVAVGQYIQLVEGDPLGGYRATMIAKVSAAGDRLWSRLDTLFDHTTIFSRPYLSGVVVLPSGSIIACGQVDKISPSPAKSFGWLIKVDKDGCMEPGCNPLVSGTNWAAVEDKFTIFPNPVVDQLTISGEGPFSVQLLDAHGRLLYTQTQAVAETQLDLSAYPSGYYFVRIKRGSVWLMKKVVKL